MVVVSNYDDASKLRALLVEMDNSIADAKGQIDKFLNKSNKIAGTRARKSLQNTKVVCAAIRGLIQSIKNGGCTKSSVKKPKKK